MLLLLAVTVVVVLAYRKRYLPVGWLWFLGTLVPMIGIKQVGTQAMADRYGYLPFVGLFIMVCWLIGDWAGQIRPRLTLVRGLAVVVLIAFSMLAHAQVELWDDYITLWTHALDVTHNNWVAENNLGTALLKQGRAEEAIPHFRAAYIDYPYDANCILNLGVYEQLHHHYPEAIEWYKKATEVARNPRTQSRAFNNLGYAYKATGDLIGARENLQKAVQIDPEFVGAWISLGVVAQRTGELPLAVEAYSRAEQMRPTDYGYLLLAGALEASGQKDQAAAARQKAELLSTNIRDAQRQADDILSRNGSLRLFPGRSYRISSPSWSLIDPVKAPIGQKEFRSIREIYAAKGRTYRLPVRSPAHQHSILIRCLKCKGGFRTRVAKPREF